MHFVHESADVTNVVHQTIRAAFEYQGKQAEISLNFVLSFWFKRTSFFPFRSKGQKCSACSRIYVPDTLWPQIREGLVREHAKIKVGDVDGMHYSFA
jgi:1-pyrroline-5-carboxylate dehydrogenase